MFNTVKNLLEFIMFCVKSKFIYIDSKKCNRLYDLLDDHTQFRCEESVRGEISRCKMKVRRGKLLDVFCLKGLSKKARAIYISDCVETFGQKKIENYYSIKIPMA